MNRDNLISDVEAVIAYSQAYPFDISVDKLIDLWEKAKAPYIELFGGEPIMKYPKKVVIELDALARHKKFEGFLCALEEDVSCEALRWKAENGLTLSEFLEDNELGFFDNKTIIDYPSLKITRGTKLLRCFKYFSPSFSTTRVMQDLASRFIQESVITGTLCLSVHPLDYLTLSENTSNWRSCHSLDGEYRAGNLSYMVDDTTVVAYLCSDNPVPLKCMPPGMFWNNKKWRILLHTDEFNRVCYYSRQYPFDSNELLDYVEGFVPNSKKFTPVCYVGINTVGFNDSEDRLDINYMRGYKDTLYDTREVIDESDYRGYCDLIHSPSYAPKVAVNKEKRSEYQDIVYCGKGENPEKWRKGFIDLYGIKIGKRVPCVKCGEMHISRTDSFLCDDCIALEDADTDYFPACECCGSRIYPNEPIYIVDGEHLCEHCFHVNYEIELKEGEEDDG